MTAGKLTGLILLTMVFIAWADDVPGETARVRLIAGLTEEKAYLPRFKAIRALAEEPPLTPDERSALAAFLRRTDGTEGVDEMELAALKNDVAERLLKLPGIPGTFARDLLEMQAAPAQSATWRNYCVQFLGRVYTSTASAELRAAIRERLFSLADFPDPETCGTSLLALAALYGNAEIDSARAAARAMAVAKDPANKEGLRFTALQVAAGLGHAGAVPLAREWLAGEKSVNLRAVAIGILGKHGQPFDRALIEPYLQSTDPRLTGAARSVIKTSRKCSTGE